MPKRNTSWVIGCVVVPAVLIAAVLLMAGISVYLDTQREKRMPAAERNRQRLTALAVMDKYTTGLGRVYEAMARTNFDDLGSTPCPADALVRAGAQQADANPGIPLVYGGFLKRFVHPEETWTADASPWTFVNSCGPGSWFETNPKTWSPYELQQGSKMIQDYMLRRYVLVLWPEDETKNRIPARTDANPDDPLVAGVHYTKGEFHGWLVAADVTNGSVVCARRLAVTSSDEIVHNQNSPWPSPLHTRMVVYHPEKDAQKEIKTDFERNLSHAIKHNMPDGVNVDMSFGPMF